MKPENYDWLARTLLSESGLVLGEDKLYLLNSRLSTLVEKGGAEDLDGLVEQLKRPGQRNLLAEVVDAMTTNETSFFRDSRPFELLFKIVLPHLAKVRATQRRLRIWSAACSSGQEAYSILMGLDQRVPQLADWRIDLVATDLSETVLERARSGMFNHFEVQRGLPAPYLVKYFDRKGRHYQLKSEITDRVQFKPLNLLRPFNHLGTFDVILCRNVLIYFDDDTRKDILDRQLGVLARDGFLFLGGGERALGITESLRQLQTPEGIVYCNAATDPTEVELVQV